MDFRVLSYVAQRPECAQGDVAAALGADPGNLVATVTRLSDAGLVSRERDPLDARRYRLDLTRPGRQLHRKAQNAIEQAERELVAELSPEETDRLAATLAQLLRHPAGV